MLGIEPARNVAAAAEERGVPTLVEFFGRELAGRARPRARAGRPRHRQQRPRPGARPQRLRRRASRSCSRRGGVATLEFPHLAPPDRGHPVRHDLPRALLVLLAARRRRGSSAAHGLVVHRRRGAADPRRVAARLPAPCTATAPRRRAGGRGAAGARASRRATPTSTGYAGFEERVREAKRALLELPDRRAARRAARSSATARPARATRCSTTAASGPTSSTTPSTATRTSRAASRPGTHIPIHDPERLAETRPDVILILPVEPPREIARQLEYTRGVGRPAHRADPDHDGGRCRIR